MLELPKYLKIVQTRGQHGLHLERVFRNMLCEELFLIAYSNLSSNKGVLTTGVDKGDTIDGMSIDRIRKVIESLKNGSYKPKPVRRQFIPKTNGKLRPLGIPSWSDKLIQEVVRMILSAYYEPQFSDNSHGFREGRGCHTALKNISSCFGGTKWFIEGDIEGCFDNIDHGILLNIIKDRIKDDKLISLIKMWLEVGYIQDWKYHKTYSGTPQGGIISPLLTNIYMNEFDKFIENLKLKFDKSGDVRKNGIERRKPNPEYVRWSNAIQRAKKISLKTGEIEDLEKYKRLKKEFEKLKSEGLPSGDPNDEEYRRLKYVRYADDFLIGCVCTKKEAEEITEKIRIFLKDKLNLNLSQDKTLITHATNEKACFLGYEISTQFSVMRRNINGEIRLNMPQSVVKEWTSKYSRGGKTYHKTELLNQSDYQIVRQYDSELRGIYQYYKMAQDVSLKVNKIKFHALFSLAKTLATKHKTSVAQIMRKHNQMHTCGLKGIKVESKGDNKKTMTAWFGAFSCKWEKFPKQMTDEKVFFGIERSDLLKRLTNNTCQLCGKLGDIEVHHIRAMKDLKNKQKWEITMSAMNRKTIVVCKQCHLDIHNGRYDGKRLTG